MSAAMHETTATVIPAGQVGVVKSNVQQPGLNCKEELVRVSEAQHDADALLGAAGAERLHRVVEGTTVARRLLSQPARL